MQNYNDICENYRTLINNSIFKVVDNITNNGTVKNAMRYSLEAGGKRVRPILLLEFFWVYCNDNDFNADKFFRDNNVNQDALSAAVAIEAVHTFSLIHDDLPCMDNDDLRRGKPSCHKAFSEETALLAGDGLSLFAVEMMSELNKNISNYERKLRAINELCRASGVCGMIGGQELDTEFETRIPDENDLLKMYTMKTSALLKAACRMGCILAGAGNETVDNAGMYAENLGLAFQITDDVLDIIGDEKKLGKPIGSDREQGKATYAALFGIDAAKKAALDYTEKAVRCLSNVPRNEFLIKLTNDLLNRIN